MFRSRYTRLKNTFLCYIPIISWLIIEVRRYFRYLGIGMKFPPDREWIAIPVFREYHISYFTVYQTLAKHWEYSINVIKIFQIRQNVRIIRKFYRPVSWDFTVINPLRGGARPLFCCWNFVIKTVPKPGFRKYWITGKTQRTDLNFL